MSGKGSPVTVAGAARDCPFTRITRFPSHHSQSEYCGPASRASRDESAWLGWVSQRGKVYKPASSRPFLAHRGPGNGFAVDLCYKAFPRTWLQGLTAYGLCK
jgi:hypothetical protein